MFIKLVNYALFLWLPFYLSKGIGVDKSLANQMATRFDLGFMLGAIVAGLLSDITTHWAGMPMRPSKQCRLQHPDKLQPQQGNQNMIEYVSLEDVHPLKMFQLNFLFGVPSQRFSFPVCVGDATWETFADTFVGGKFWGLATLSQGLRKQADE